MKLDFIHPALASLYPGVSSLDYVWQMQDSGTPEMVSWPEERFGPLDWQAVEAQCAIEALAAEKQRLLNKVGEIFETKLSTIPHDGRLFDISGVNQGLVVAWYNGAKEYEEQFAPGQPWGPEVWPHMSDGQGGYSIADLAACKVWALSMFILVAHLTKAKDAHVASIEALASYEDAQAYDHLSNWPY